MQYDCSFIFSSVESSFPQVFTLSDLNGKKNNTKDDVAITFVLFEPHTMSKFSQYTCKRLQSVGLSSTLDFNLFQTHAHYFSHIQTHLSMYKPMTVLQINWMFTALSLLIFFFFHFLPSPCKYGSIEFTVDCKKAPQK